jgi:hypothetical protein
MTYVTWQRQDDVTYAKMCLSSLVTDTMRRFSHFCEKVTGKNTRGWYPPPMGVRGLKLTVGVGLTSWSTSFSHCSWPGSKRVSTSWCRTNPDGSCWPTDRVVFYEELDTANSGRGGKTIWCNFHEIFAKFIAHVFAFFNLNNGRFFYSKAIWATTSSRNLGQQLADQNKIYALLLKHMTEDCEDTLVFLTHFNPQFHKWNIRF